MQILSSAFFFVIAIGVLVSVHEFGHFWVARRLGVKVLRFSIGFGKPLLRWRRRDDPTEYVIAAIPLGGYVQMLDEREGPVEAFEQHLAFNRKPLLSRCAVVIAGPLFNFLLAIVAYWAIFVLGVNGLKPIVGDVTPGSLAAQGGFQSRDVIERVGGTDTSTWDAVILELLSGSLQSEPLIVEVKDQDGAERRRELAFQSLSETIDQEKLMETVGVRPYRPSLPAVIGQVELDGAAAESGLRSGDRLLSWNGGVVETWSAWVNVIREHPEQTGELVIERDGGRVVLSLTPRRVQTVNGDIGRIGAGVAVPPGFGEDVTTTVRYSFLPALGMAIQKCYSMTSLTLNMLGHMVTGSVSAKNISGPISIAQYAGMSAGMGLVAFLGYLAIISISLGVLNLLPIPILDGGHLLYYLIEAVKGSPVSEQTMIFGQRIGIAMLVSVMVLAFYNDFVRLFS
jgi:regulator of sigma E protease